MGKRDHGSGRAVKPLHRRSRAVLDSSVTRMFGEMAAAFWLEQARAELA
jgi:hypothetical protein